MAKKKENPSTSSNQVQFRLPAALVRQLDNLALHEESRGVCAKRLVIEAMTQSWMERYHARLEESDERLQKLREDIATTLGMALVEFAKEDPKKVERWIQEHMLN